MTGDLVISLITLLLVSMVFIAWQCKEIMSYQEDIFKLELENKRLKKQLSRVTDKDKDLGN